MAESTEKITKCALDETSAKWVPQGAIMLGMYDTAALKAGISMVNSSCNQAVAFALINEDLVDTLYVYYAITIGREHFKRLQRGVRQKNLNLSLVKDISIPLPDKRAQNKFISLAKCVHKEKEFLTQHLNHLGELFSSLQSRAFSGEL